VINWGLGLEQGISERVSLYGAFSTDRSAIEEPFGDVNLAAATWDIYHISARAAVGIGSVEVTMGVGLGFGQDEDRDIFAGAGDTADFTYRSFRFLVGFGTTL
jgi:hypothetical protein